MKGASLWALAAFTLLFGGCANRNNLASPSNVQGSGELGQSTRKEGSAQFYRYVDGAAVYKVDSTVYCIVNDPAQMLVYGGFRQVHVVSHNTNITAGLIAAKPIGCSWPSGSYRKLGAQAAYRVYGESACRLSVSPKGTSIVLVGSNDDVLIGKRFTGNCPSK